MLKWVRNHRWSTAFIILVAIYIICCILDAKNDTNFGYWVAMVIIWWGIIWIIRKYVLKKGVKKQPDDKEKSTTTIDKKKRL